MSFTPMPKNTTIYVCHNVPIASDYSHTIYPDTRPNQKTSMSSFLKFTLSPASYQRYGDNTLRVEGIADSYYDCNYMYFENVINAAPSKTFYCFITDVRYVNDHTTEIDYVLDVFQTYFFDVKVLPSFVEREHTVSDEIGENIVPEHLQLGEYTCSQTYNRFVTNPSSLQPNIQWYIMIKYVPNSPAHLQPQQHNKFNTRFWAGSPAAFPAGVQDWGGYCCMNGFPEAYTYICTPLYQSTATEIANSMLNLTSLCNALIEMSATIIGIDLIPTEIANDYYIPSESESSWYWIEAPAPHTWTLHQPSSFRPENPDDSWYIPRCKKLFTSPFMKLVINNNQGEVSEFNWEDFGRASASSAVQADFHIYNVTTPYVLQHLCPLAYKGVPEYFEAGLTVTGFPTMSWSEDTMAREYEYAQRNRDYMLISAGLNGGMAAASTLAGAATGTMPFTMAHETRLYANAAVQNINGIKESLIETERMAAIPDNFKGKSAGSPILIREGRYGFSGYCMTITAEMAKIIDDYFWAYGYACHQVKVPNILSGDRSLMRNFWNYVKTKGAAVVPVTTSPNYQGASASVCAEFAAILDKGITVWMRKDYVGRYDYNNAP